MLAQETPVDVSVFQEHNLVAWCIVPYDAKNRGPTQRAEMVKRLGISRVAYDWRSKHVATFEQEIVEYKKRNIDFFAFWSWHDAIEPLVKKHGIRPQIWHTAPSPEADTDQARVKASAAQLSPLVAKTKTLGLKFGIYNHGGWAGDPKNLVAICEYLRLEHESDHIGIVYNFHHGHDHIKNFAESLKRMQPYLLCLNLNGMADPTVVDVNQLQHKIKPIGTGVYEAEMMDAILASQYSGPIGVLGHRKDVDAEEAVRLNLDGLRKYRSAASKRSRSKAD